MQVFLPEKRSISPPAAYLRGTPHVSGLLAVAGLRLLWQDLAPGPEVLPLSRFGAFSAAASLAPRFRPRRHGASARRPGQSRSLGLPPGSLVSPSPAVPRAGSPTSSSTPTPFVAPHTAERLLQELGGKPASG